MLPFSARPGPPFTSEASQGVEELVGLLRRHAGHAGVNARSDRIHVGPRAEFRVALRDALEQVKDLAGAHGIFNMSPGDHLGLDQRARVMVKIENGTWKYQP